MLATWNFVDFRDILRMKGSIGTHFYNYSETLPGERIGLKRFVQLHGGVRAIPGYGLHGMNETAQKLLIKIR